MENNEEDGDHIIKYFIIENAANDPINQIIVADYIDWEPNPEECRQNPQFSVNTVTSTERNDNNCWSN